MLYLDAILLLYQFCLHVIAVIVEHLRSAGGVAFVCLGTVFLFQLRQNLNALRPMCVHFVGGWNRVVISFLHIVPVFSSGLIGMVLL